MARIILDCELMKTRDSGLYHYCLNLGQAINDVLKKQQQSSVKFYVPPGEENSFSNRADTIVEKPYHKFFRPFLFDCKVWHRPFQGGRLIPHSKSNPKIVLTIHDLNVLHQDLPQQEKEASLSNTQQLINRSHAIVCVSEFSKADVIKNCQLNGTPIYVIHNGANELMPPLLSENSYQPTKPFLFTIGFINQKKNLHSLVPLLEKNKDLELVMAGRLDDATYVEDLKRQAHGAGTADRLHILGPVTEGEKAWYLANCHAFMHPSFAEGFGLPVVEAMAFGKPIFTSNLTSLPEIGGNMVFYFDNFHVDHMQKVFEEGMKTYTANDMADNIRRRSKEFNWHTSAKKYIDVYRSLL